MTTMTTLAGVAANDKQGVHLVSGGFNRKSMRIANRIVFLVFLLGLNLALVFAQERRLREPDVIFVPTPQNVVDEMLKLAKVHKSDVVYDLGCGDGRLVITAAK